MCGLGVIRTRVSRQGRQLEPPNRTLHPTSSLLLTTTEHETVRNPPARANYLKISRQSTRKLGLFRRLITRLFPLNLEQHHAELTLALGNLLDAVLRNDRGSTAMRATQVAAKLASASAVTSAMFGAAALFGTASTGTAIGTLSGAAFTNAALYWIGGSVATGGMMLLTIPIAISTGAWFGSKWAWRRWISGKPRKESDLDEIELGLKRSVEAIVVSLIGTDGKQRLQPSAYFVLWNEALPSILEEVESRSAKDYANWPILAKRRLRRAVKALQKLRRKAEGSLPATSSIPISMFTATVMELLSDEVELTNDQELVVDAFRLQYPDLLGEATTEEIAHWLSELSVRSPRARDGALNAAKGKYHELLYTNAENNDGDDWYAEIILPSNHAGSDIKLTNNKTGEIIEKQLKADNVAGIREHQHEYTDIPLAATSEAAAQTGVEDSGFSGQKLDDDVRKLADVIESSEAPLAIAEDAFAAGSTAAFIALALNVGRALSRKEQLKEAVGGSIGKSGTAFAWGGGTSLLAELIT